LCAGCRMLTRPSAPRADPSPPLASPPGPPIGSICPHRFQRRQRSPPLSRAGASVTSHSSTPTAPLSPGRLRLVIVAMSLGAFAIGTTEFASMGLLPQIARDLAVSIPQAGMLITLYALGVVIGAPLVTIAAVRIPRARLLVLLIALIGVGNLLSAIAPDFTVLASAR